MKKKDPCADSPIRGSLQPLHVDDGIDQCFGRSVGAGATLRDG